ncbi:unnamed protein product [Pedinophyceae sp. YPF-701]|nr:unnamed protein product [Pedinophyceae sp. YPF-701]
MPSESPVNLADRGLASHPIPPDIAGSPGIPDRGPIAPGSMPVSTNVLAWRWGLATEGPACEGATRADPARLARASVARSGMSGATNRMLANSIAREAESTPKAFVHIQSLVQRQQQDRRKGDVARPTRGMFMFQPYSQQPPLDMSTEEVEAVVEAVLGPGPTGRASNGTLPEDIPAEMEEVFTGLLVKLIVDMWLKCGPEQALPLALILLVKALGCTHMAWRCRVFDVLFNLALHGSLLEAPPDAGAQGRSLSDHFRAMLRPILWELLTQLAETEESEPQVWQSALSCFLLMASEGGVLLRRHCEHVPMQALRQFLLFCQLQSWSPVLYQHLQALTCNLLFVVQSPSSAPLSKAHWSEMQLSQKRLDDLGGITWVVQQYQEAQEAPARQAFMTVILDYTVQKVFSEELDDGASDQELVQWIATVWNSLAMWDVLHPYAVTQRHNWKTDVRTWTESAIERGPAESSVSSWVTTGQRPGRVAAGASERRLLETVLRKMESLFAGDDDAEAAGLPEELVEHKNATIESVHFPRHPGVEESWEALEKAMYTMGEQRDPLKVWIAEILERVATKEHAAYCSRGKGDRDRPQPIPSVKAARGVKETEVERRIRKVLHAMFERGGPDAPLMFVHIAQRLATFVGGWLHSGIEMPRPPNPGSLLNGPPTVQSLPILLSTVDWLMHYRALPGCQAAFLRLTRHLLACVCRGDTSIGGSETLVASEGAPASPGGNGIGENAARTATDMMGQLGPSIWQEVTGSVESPTVSDTALRQIPAATLYSLFDVLSRSASLYTASNTSACGLYAVPLEASDIGPVRWGLWASSIEDLRLLLLVLLLGKSEESPAELVDSKGQDLVQPLLQQLLKDADPRLQYYASACLLRRIQVKSPDVYSQAMRRLVVHAQHTNDEKILENPYLRLMAMKELDLVP